MYISVDKAIIVLVGDRKVIDEQLKKSGTIK